MAKPASALKKTNTAHPVDVVVGRNLRAYRKRLGASQAIMGAALGLTFQQVQKYEKGANRISASKLYPAAEGLAINVEYFFAGLPRREGERPALAGSDPALTHLAGEPGGLDLAQAFCRIKAARSRRLVVDLAPQLAGAEGADDPVA